MMRAQALLDRDGLPVVDVMVPDWHTPPEVIFWGVRTFVRRESGEYREGFSFVATVEVTK